MAQVVPVSIAIIFVILFVLFGNARDAGLVLLNVPYAAVGGILALLITSFNFSISAGIGFIALFGICIQNGVIMISDIKNNLRERHPLEDSIKMSVKSVLIAQPIAPLIAPKSATIPVTIPILPLIATPIAPKSATIPVTIRITQAFTQAIAQPFVQPIAQLIATEIRPIPTTLI